MSNLTGEYKREIESETNWSERSEQREDRIQSVLFWIRVIQGVALHVLILLFFAGAIIVFFDAMEGDKEFVQEFFLFAFVPVLLTSLVLVSGPLSKLKDIISFFRR